MLRIDRPDNLVLTVADIEATTAFYWHVLGMKRVRFEERHALRIGTTKIDPHDKGREFEPKAADPTAGASDLCFVTLDPIALIAEQLAREQLARDGIAIQQGPVARTGTLGTMRSIDIRTPDRNVVEFVAYEAESSSQQNQDITL